MDALGAHFSVDSARGGGTTVHADVPVRRY
jgi:hypothetical protein